MLALLLASLAAPAAVASPPTVAVVAPRQDPELKEKIKEFNAILASREDEEKAVALMDSFLVRFKAAESRSENLGAELEAGEGDDKALKIEIKALTKEMDAIADTIHSAFTHKRRKEVNQANLMLWKAGAYSLGQMGERGADLLWQVFEDKKRFRKEPDFRGLCLEQIGYTLTYSYTENLVDLLHHSEYLFIARAADALAQFGEAPGEMRKLAVDRCVKLLAEYYEAHASDPKDVEAQEKYRKVGGAMMRALEALTGVTQSEPLAWRTWYNKNKNDKELWED